MSTDIKRLNWNMSKPLHQKTPEPTHNRFGIGLRVHLKSDKTALKKRKEKKRKPLTLSNHMRRFYYKSPSTDWFPQLKFSESDWDHYRHSWGMNCFTWYHYALIPLWANTTAFLMPLCANFWPSRSKGVCSRKTKLSFIFFSAGLWSDPNRTLSNIVKCVRPMFTSRHGTVQCHASLTSLRPAHNHFACSEPTELHAPKPLNRQKVHFRQDCMQCTIYSQHGHLHRTTPFSTKGNLESFETTICKRHSRTVIKHNTNTIPLWHCILRERIWTWTFASIKNISENITLDSYSLVPLRKSIFGLSFASEVSQHLIYFTAGISSEKVTSADIIVLWFRKIERGPYSWFYRTGWEQAKRPKFLTC